LRLAIHSVGSVVQILFLTGKTRLSQTHASEHEQVLISCSQHTSSNREKHMHIGEAYVTRAPNTEPIFKKTKENNLLAKIFEI
jgi:hypothetical protein